jgi:hypothetical protein
MEPMAHPFRLTDDSFNRQRILPEEERRNRNPPPLFDGSFRWFRSPNIIDLWHYRSEGEKRRIVDLIWRRRLGL